MLGLADEVVCIALVFTTVVCGKSPLCQGQVRGFVIAGSLFDNADRVYSPRRVEFFEPERIILAKGSLSSSRRQDFIEQICRLCPAGEVVEELDKPHNRIDLGNGDSLQLHYRGKQTLVFGEHNSAVRLSEEQGNTCPNYWHFSPYGFCPYDCKYCYLAGTPGVKFSPTVKIYLNLDEIIYQIAKTAATLNKPTSFYLGKLQDGLALDPLTGYSRVMIPFFAQDPYARQILLTKSADVGNLLGLDHAGHTILSWSLNPAGVWSEFEANSPLPSERIKAMKKCAAAGYPVRAVIMPIIPVERWEEVYADFLSDLLENVQLERITLGCICSYPAALGLMEAKLGCNNLISQALSMGLKKSSDGRTRYPKSLRLKMYSHLISVIGRYQPELEVSLCLEEQAIFETLGLTASLGRCNCVL